MKISLRVALKLWWGIFWRHICYSFVLGGVLGIVISVVGLASLTHSVLGTAHPATTAATAQEPNSTLPRHLPQPASSAPSASVTAIPAGMLLAIAGGYSLLFLISVGLGVLAVKQAVPKHLQAMVDSVNENNRNG